MLDLDSACNNPNFFDTSDFLSISLHFIGCLVVPVHIFGAYCILFITPPTMKSIKLSLLNFHFWTCFLDFGLGFLSTPYVFIPALAGYPLGFLTYLGVPSAEQTYLMLTGATVVIVSIISLFENRFYILMGDSGSWRIARRFVYILNYVAAISCFLICYLRTPEQKMAFVFMRNLLSCVPPYVDQSRIFIFTIYSRYFLIPGVICFGTLFFQLFLFPCLTSRILRKHKRKMSKVTAEMQNKFQKALIFQVVLPVIILAIPIFYIGFSTLFWYHNQTLNNISFIIVSSHGFFSTISMIFLHSAYRDYTTGLLCFRYGGSEKSAAASVWDVRSVVIT